MSLNHSDPYLGKTLLDINLTDQDLGELFVWLDRIPLSKKKKNITRDFSDGSECPFIT